MSKDEPALNDSITAEELIDHLDDVERWDMKSRKDKYFNLGFSWLHYIHYYPRACVISRWGFEASAWKYPSIDFYFGKHVFVFSFRGR
jgi:hypothetical protein